MCSVLLSIVVGCFLGKFMINQYNDFQLSPVINKSNSLFFLQQGVYKNEDEMKDKMSDFSFYIYNLEGDSYYTYVGITKSLENAEKIKEYFKNKGYDIYIKDIGINNDAFITVVEQYDLLLNDASGDAIVDICYQVLSSYEELVVKND